MLIAYIEHSGVHNAELTLVSSEYSRYRSYKLPVNISDNDKIMRAEMWPNGTMIERWRVRRNDARN